MTKKQLMFIQSVSKGKLCNLKSLKAIKEVIEESPNLDFFGEVPVGARDDADIDPDGFRAADCPDLLLLDHAQQLHLQVQGHLADLVEEDRAAVGGGEQAWAALHGAGESALDVPEQLAFEKRLGD